MSHSSHDDAFVRELQVVLGDHGQLAWIDSRELRGGTPLWSEIQKAIEAASAFVVVVSPDAFQSPWVGRELQYALEVRKRRGIESCPVVPLLLDGTRLGVLGNFFEEEPTYIAVSSKAGGIEDALDSILVALGQRLPADLGETTRQIPATLVEDLVLELSDLKFVETNGTRSAAARARLVYEPAAPERPRVTSGKSWRFVAPPGPPEANELYWYFEKYIDWPSENFRPRAQQTENSLAGYGKRLHDSALPAAQAASVIGAWAKNADHASLRLSVLIDPSLDDDAPENEVQAARAAALALLAIPWELLHDGTSFVLEGAAPACVRRRIPNTRLLDVAAVTTPIRILLLTPRPEDDLCPYIDHRLSAIPLVNAVESLGGRVELHLLEPATLATLRNELDRARSDDEPYHVVHFDGHGTYDPRLGFGGLCFEEPQDVGKLTGRRHVNVPTQDVGQLLRDLRVPLVLLEARQTTRVERAPESLASGLLQAGVASVVVMTYSTTLEASQRFVSAFYDSLARGGRVGEALLQGQRTLKDDSFRGQVFGAGERRLQDWFVPVLFQEKDDPQLFRDAAPSQARADVRTALSARMGALPREPETGFIGRSRELLTLERLLRNERYAVLRGQGGEGKTALAAEFGRWMVRSRRFRRATFIAIQSHATRNFVLDALGRQLIPEYAVATFEDAEKAVQAVERTLVEQSTLLVIDNMESLLPPPNATGSQVLDDDIRRQLNAVLDLCARLQTQGATRVVFTSREEMPAPFDGVRNRRDLRQLERADAVTLVERAVNLEGTVVPALSGSTREDIEALVDVVDAHARTLALLGPSLRNRGVEATRLSLVELMTEMDRRFRGSPERSIFASIELSLRRLSKANRERAQSLGVFQGGVFPTVLRVMTRWEDSDVASLLKELVETGLATEEGFRYFRLSPGLSAFLNEETDTIERERLRGAWADAMVGYVGFLEQIRGPNPEAAWVLAAFDMSNLLAFIEYVQQHKPAELTATISSSLFNLFQQSGRPRLLEHLSQIREEAAGRLASGWTHAQFMAELTRILQQLESDQSQRALDGARQLMRRTDAAGETAYPDARYDLASAYWVLARGLGAVGHGAEALATAQAALKRFDAIRSEEEESDSGAARMAANCVLEITGALINLGRLDDAEVAAQDVIERGEKVGTRRFEALGQRELGEIYVKQRRFHEGAAAYDAARKAFTLLGEPESVAATWSGMGRLFAEAGKPEDAEDALRNALAIHTRIGNTGGEARTLNELGNLYAIGLERYADAAGFYRNAVAKYMEIPDPAGEIIALGNLADALRKLHRFDEARDEVQRAIALSSQARGAAEPWRRWSILAEIEREANDMTASAEASHNAVTSYLGFRRLGGQNTLGSGRLAGAVTGALLSGDRATAENLLRQHAAASDVPLAAQVFIAALQQIVTGSRDAELANSPELDYTMAAEILLLLERLSAETPGVRT